MGTTQLKLYNGALKILGETKLSSTSEAREPRYALDDVYDDALAYCLADGQWNHTVNQAQISSTSTPTFGFSYGIAKPSDFVRLLIIASDENFCSPLVDVNERLTLWETNTSPVYVRYVSNSVSIGMDLTKWHPHFTRYVEYELAERICMQVTQSAEKFKEIAGALKPKARKAALNFDAMNDPAPKRKPVGSFVRSRGDSGDYSGRFVSNIYYR